MASSAISFALAKPSWTSASETLGFLEFTVTRMGSCTEHSTFTVWNFWDRVNP